MLSDFSPCKTVKKTVFNQYHSEHDKLLLLGLTSFARLNSSFEKDSFLFANLKIYTFSVSSELSQAFARGLALIAFLRNITLLAMNKKAIGEQFLLRAASKLR